MVIVPESQVAWRSASAAARHVPQIFSTAGEDLKLTILWVLWTRLHQTDKLTPRPGFRTKGLKLSEAESIFNMAMRKF